MAAPATDRELVRRHGFKAFIELAWAEVEACDLIWEPHLDLVASHYEAVKRREIRDIVFNVPPGTSKSLLSQILFPAWVWTDDPGHKFMSTVYSEDLSLDFARRCMDLITSEWYTERWSGVKVRRGARAAVADFWLTAGGRRFATMMGGQATGAHAHTLIVDDPHKPDDLSDAESAKRVLDEDWKRFTGTFSTRRADAASFARIVVMQRLHELDLAGRLLELPGTVGVVLPMRFEPHRRYVSPWGSDWRTEDGELLCPRRFPKEVVDADELTMTERDFVAQMQQRPAPEAGALFKKEWFERRWAELPRDIQYLISVDSSLKEGKDSDFTVAQVWGWKGCQYYLLDQVRDRMSFGGQLDAISELRRRWPNVQRVLIEAKANGDAIIDSLRRRMTGVEAVHPLGGKVARAQATEPMLRGGNVLFPAYASWVAGLVGEALAFPVGSNDDQVDCMTQALLWLHANQGNENFHKAMSNVRKGSAGRLLKSLIR